MSSRRSVKAGDAALGSPAGGDVQARAEKFEVVEEALGRPVGGAMARDAGAVGDRGVEVGVGRQRLGARGAPPKNQSTPSTSTNRHQNRARRIDPPRWLHPVVILVAVLPFAWIVYALASDYFQGTRLLGSNPIKEAEHGTGEMTVRLLLATLAITPAIKLSKQGWLIRYRRTFGLLAFAYACVHLLIYFVLDLELVWGDLAADLEKRVYIMFGMGAFLLLLPLALTSTKASIRRLGASRWNALHRAVYGTVALGMVHYWMAVKRDITAPLLFATLFAALFAFRLWWARRAPRAT